MNCILFYGAILIIHWLLPGISGSAVDGMHLECNLCSISIFELSRDPTKANKYSAWLYKLLSSILWFGLGANTILCNLLPPFFSPFPFPSFLSPPSFCFFKKSAELSEICAVNGRYLWKFGLLRPISTRNPCRPYWRGTYAFYCVPIASNYCPALNRTINALNVINTNRKQRHYWYNNQATSNQLLHTGAINLVKNSKGRDGWHS